MKTKHFLTFAMLCLAASASAQIQLLYMNDGRNVIDRTKKLYWMDGDDDPCFDILNYKKTGNKETFTIKGKEKAAGQQYSVVITLGNNSEPTHLVLKEPKYTVHDSDVRTASKNKEEDDRLRNYFGGLAGYPAKQQSATGVGVPSKPSVGGGDAKADVSKEGAKSEAGKAGEAVKGAIGKVKGVFKKKK